MTVSEINQWTYHILSTHGYILKNNLPETVQHTPWSEVVRFDTDKGFVYLKQTPNELAIEAIIIQVLRDKFHALVPEIIAFNVELNCFLMKDAGKSLRTILKQKFSETLMCKAIDQFTNLQIITADKIDILINIGVPD